MVEETVYDEIVTCDHSYDRLNIFLMFSLCFLCIFLFMFSFLLLILILKIVYVFFSVISFYFKCCYFS